MISLNLIKIFLYFYISIIVLNYYFLFSYSMKYVILLDSDHSVEYISKLLSNERCFEIVSDITDIQKKINNFLEIEQKENDFDLIDLSLSDDFEEEIKENTKTISRDIFNVNRINKNEIVNEVIAKKEKTEASVKNDSLDAKKAEYKQTVSSYALGKIGEQEVYEMLQSVRPSLDISKVATTGHLADILAIDYNRNIKYVIEIKLKQDITRNDINKFEIDLETAKKDISYEIKGIFLSLNSDRIPMKGNLSIDRDKVYLTKQYVTKEVLTIVFDMYEIYCNLSISANKIDNKKITYEIPENVFKLIANLRNEYKEINLERDMLTTVLQNSKTNIVNVESVLVKLQLKQEFIKMINNEFGEITNEVNTDIHTDDESKLKEYINKTPKYKIAKKYLLNNFPTLANKLGAMSLVDIIKEYRD